jgi:hypothetical protein
MRLYKDEIRSAAETRARYLGGQPVRRTAKVTTATAITTVATVSASNRVMWRGWGIRVRWCLYVS